MTNKRTKKDSVKFVFEHYEANKFNTKDALNKFKQNNNITTQQKKYRLQIASIAAAVIIGLFITARFVFIPSDEQISIIANNNTVKHYLPDSSLVVIGKNSSIAYNPKKFNSQNRKIDMKGQAYFDVQRNENLPFEVISKNTKTKVLGTKFQITDNESNTEIFVKSGKVQFLSCSSNKGVILTQNMFAQLNNNEELPKVIEPQLENPLAWIFNEFTYNNTPLTKVLNELSAFYGVELKCNDLDKSLTATFEAESLDQIIPLIEKALDVEIATK